MAGIVHAKVSTVADASTATDVRPTSNWNADHTIDGTVILSSGSTSNTPLQFVAGALNTVATGGALEFDGVCFYQTAIDATRQVTRTEQIITQQSSRTLTTSTSPQKMFNETTNGTLTVGAGTYLFDCAGSVTGFSTSAHTLGWGFGGTATLSTQGWYAATKQGTDPGTLANAVSAWFVAASTAISQNTTQPSINFYMSGKVVVNAGGTLIPNVHIPANNATAAVLQDGFFRIYPIGSSVVGSVGNWS
jgi:hypothetical protein